MRYKRRQQRLFLGRDTELLIGTFAGSLARRWHCAYTFLPSFFFFFLLPPSLFFSHSFLLLPFPSGPLLIFLPFVLLSPIFLLVSLLFSFLPLLLSSFLPSAPPHHILNLAPPLLPSLFPLLAPSFSPRLPLPLRRHQDDATFGTHAQSGRRMGDHGERRGKRERRGGGRREKRGRAACS